MLPHRVYWTRIAAEWTEALLEECRRVTSLISRPPGAIRPTSLTQYPLEVTSPLSLGLAVLLVGNRPDSVLYVTRKQEACAKIGINMEIVSLPETINQQQLEEEVQRVCRHPSVDGVLVQLPLPRHLDEGAVMERLDPAKDVDGFHPLNMG